MDASTWAWSLAAASWSIRITMLPVVVTRKDQPVTCLAWLSLIFFQPWVGLGLYLLIGENRLGRRRLRRREAALAERETPGSERLSKRPSESSTPTDSAARDDSPALSPELSDEHRTLVSLAQRVGEFPVTGGNAVTLFSDNDTVVDRLLEDIAAAECHVHLLFYIFLHDDVGQRVCDALIAARDRGVACRVLVDAVGSAAFLKRDVTRLSQAGVEVHAVLPVRLVRRRFARLDLRNHRKLAIIDGRIAWTGSQNIVESTYGHKRAGYWRDVMGRLTGPAVRNLQTVFAEDWFHETDQWLDSPDCFPELRIGGSIATQVIPTGPDAPTEDVEHLLVEAIHCARRRVIITSPYFVPSEPLLLALRLAALRGVSVELIVPRRSDQRLVDAAGAWYCGKLLTYGVRVFRFHDGLLHAKTLTIDDQFGLFGSANYDVRSFHLNFELNLAFFEAHIVQELRWLQESYRSHSTELTRDDWQRRPRWKQLGANLAKLFSPLL